MPPVSSPSTSPDADARRSAVRPIAKRYRRAERAVSWLVALSVAGAFLAAFALADLLPALAVGAVLLVAVRTPFLRRRGTTRLLTDASPEAVTEAFASATPPVLAFQWAVADEVRPTSDGAGGAYEHSSLVGLRTYSLEIATETEAHPDGNATDADPADPASDDGVAPVARVRIEGTLDGAPWGAYAVSIRDAADGAPGETVVDVELLSRRRFGLRSVPQALVADAYYADAVAAQGYAVADRDVSFAVSR
ncbi:hypothetical protein [Halorubrum sp. Hd13]|uniref:hypothetical protein n=1 Tax=Halorubrum sp. Hd13 TaxID=1480728 RepID=UPI000B9821B5|nr:hypothetical protein [Halorubrum sp. Hd13]OYR45716.1 hypothetical protein DJ81_04130 [Halorubrum sp. Hd13]